MAYAIIFVIGTIIYALCLWGGAKMLSIVEGPNGCLEYPVKIIPFFA